MKDIACVIIYLYWPVLILCRPSSEGNIGYETLIPNIGKVDLSAVERLINAAVGQNGRQYFTQVNGKPVTIEIIDADQMPNHQTSNSQSYWPQQNFNREQWPQRTQQRPQANVYITKDTRYSSYPNIEVYDVYTGEGPINQRYPNRRYPNGQLIPVGPIRTYPERNVYPYNPVKTPDPYAMYNNRYPGDINSWNTNIYDNSKQSPEQPTNQRRPNMVNHTDSSSPRPEIKDTSNDDSIKQDNKDPNQLDSNKNPNISKEPKKSDSNNVAGYINKFPVILLNENEIRK
ncbi:uncharacterized protein [Diabrotica undecimpunctata]|uniref:uncharacterized protein n=1 Tax=Diabrotica undecimpunctata TaxID=50387 RepID=UPI003B6363A9